jgi:hypothetical protein
MHELGPVLGEQAVGSAGPLNTAPLDVTVVFDSTHPDIFGLTRQY